MINANPILSIQTANFRFKDEKDKQKAYTPDQRKALLSYVESLEQDAYTLALKLAFHGTFRISKLKALRKSDITSGTINVKNK